MLSRGINTETTNCRNGSGHAQRLPTGPSSTTPSSPEIPRFHAFSALFNSTCEKVEDHTDSIYSVE
jgi:hypothetical protein